MFYSWKFCLRVCQNQIILNQFFQEIHGAGTVCQPMKYFKIHAVIMVTYLKQKRLFVWNIEAAARWSLFLFYCGMNVSSLQIKPKKSFTKYCLKQWVFFHSLIQSPLQNFTVNCLFQLTVKTEYSGVIFTCYKWKSQCCIIQFSPF